MATTQNFPLQELKLNMDRVVDLLQKIADRPDPASPASETAASYEKMLLESFGLGTTAAYNPLYDLQQQQLLKRQWKQQQKRQ